MENAVICRIQEQVQAGLPELAPYIRRWVEAHLVIPYRMELYTDWRTDAQVTMWMVTDNTGHEDSNCHVVFDENANCFGLEDTILAGGSGRVWYMGPYGEFAETVNGM